MSRFVHLDRSKFEDQRRKLEQRLYQKMSRIKADTTRKTEMAAVYVAEQLAAATFPTSQSIGIAVAAIRFDVSRVYITPGKAFEILREGIGQAKASAFYAATKRGDWTLARSILRASGTSIQNIKIGDPLNPDYHEVSRNTKGRVNLLNPLQIVTSEELKAYSKTAVARLGKTASGWLACAERLGGDGNSIRWKGTAVHGSDGGKVNIRNDKTKVSYILTNTRPLAKKLISAGQVKRIMADGHAYLARLLGGR
jgi:hypothetical protein